ncbi:sensor histidine kinase [Streptomyces sp. NBC_01602]|uniref:sensor histidine kinase n=1 Tax=Streptomyces sp. NBC_01602 TaxID=2975893 RepID=UPI0038690826|nr:histidine kinase [Streptomyces sp. NBC_01602]
MIARLRSWYTAHPRLQDPVLALAWALVLCAATGIVALTAGSDIRRATLLTALACLPLAWRSRAPVTVVFAAMALDLLHLLLMPPDARVIYPTSTLVALYCLAGRKDRPTTWWLTAAAAVTTAASGVLLRSGWNGLLDNINLVPWVCLPPLVADVLRNRREALAAAEERAARAERTRDEEAARQVTEERARIARDLHDVVAHRITLINAQSGAALHLWEKDPSLAPVVLARVQDASRAALDELRSTVRLLAETPESDSVTPLPGLADVREVVEEFRYAGLEVDVVHEGTTKPLTSAADLAAYRIIQEALTNTHKHARPPASARVTIRYLARSVRITIEDNSPSTAPPDASAAHGSGQGLIGMRERALAAGGAFAAGPVVPPGTGFRVDAELPLQPDTGNRPA